MARQSKIEKHGLAFAVVAWRNEGLTVPQIVERANLRLNGEDTISVASVERYFASLPAQAAPVLHQGRTAEVVAGQVESFADQFAKLNRITRGWLDEAEEAKVMAYGDHGPQELGPDWNARTKVAKELREQIKLMADTMERIYNAEQIKLFQESVLEAIAEVSPEVAQAIRQKLKERTEIRRAALLGV